MSGYRLQVPERSQANVKAILVKVQRLESTKRYSRWS
jgi:hypothetical protein